MYRAFGKRLFDLIFSFVGLLFLSPLFLIVPALIKVDTRGPVFFFQKRMGQFGRPFSLLKFRSMTIDRDEKKTQFEPGSTQRVTRVGEILRKTKIDEIPQLINVFVGEMSFVGPRPEVERYKDFYTGPFAEVLSVKPGITDQASIKYRHEEKILMKSENPEQTYREVILPDKLEMALTYVKDDAQFFKDIQIMGQTVLSIMKGKE